MAKRHSPLKRALILVGALAALAGCDIDLRNNFGNAPDTSNAARMATAPRPQADDRGVISYPNYQVAVAKRGDTVADVATRIGLGAGELANYNGITTDVPLRNGEILALPRRVEEPSPETGALTTGPLQPNENIDITTLAGGAIERAGPTRRTTPNAPSGVEPVRHQVERGETAYSIARLYNVSVRSLSQWNGLGANLSVREGQFLLIPVASPNQPERTATTTAPGAGSPTPTPPSAEKPLPASAPTTKPAPASPNLGDQRTATSNARLLYPVQGNIIRAYSAKSDGIDIAAKAGTPVKAADAGTVGAILRSVDKTSILVIRHADNLLTVYTNLEDISVKKGDLVKRGQIVAKVQSGENGFLHFEVRKGPDSVDPMPYLN